MPGELQHIAFKVNWVYGEHGPWTTPCTPEGRLISILREGHVWCSQPENECHRLVDTDEVLPVDARPCMDYVGYRELRFVGGTHHSGPHKGKGTAIHRTDVGKLAFLTSRRRDMAEEDRIIIACFRIDEKGRFPSGEDYVAADPSKPYALRVPLDRLDDAPRFWAHRAEDESRMWGSGLFRYVGNDEAERMWQAMEAVCETTHVTVLRDLEAIRLEEEHAEGQKTTRLVSYFERNPDLRSAAIAVHGTRCQACGMTFVERYGELGEGFIEVHHLKPVADYEGEVSVNPETDMAVVCPNCHRVLHRGQDELLTVEELRGILQTRGGLGG